MPIARFLQGEAFEQADIAVMGRALEKAMAAVAPARDASLVKEELARRIIREARNGIRDPDALAAYAVQGFGINLAGRARR